MDKTDGFKKVIIFSNYSWAYLSSAAVKKHFPDARATLVTVNTRDISKRHDFGMSVIEINNIKSGKRLTLSGQIGLFSKMDFDTAVIDHGFNLNIILLLSALQFKEMFLIDFAAQEELRPITRRALYGLFFHKMAYFMNKALIEMSKRLRLSVSLGLPSEMSIETTTICNLTCKGCPTGLGQIARPALHIKKDLFYDIVGKNRRNFKYLDVIYPFIFGEPLLNSEIFEYIRKLRELSCQYTRIELHTNGNIKNSKDIAVKLLRSGVDLINISVDGTDRAAYENFRRGGDFDLVCEFVKNLADAKREMKILRPEIVMQMIVTRYSQDQVSGFDNLRKRLGADRLTFKEFFHEFTKMADEEGYAIAPSNKDLALDKERKEEIITGKNNLCGWAYRSISIMCDGSAAPCCIDFNTSLLGGLALTGGATINKIWNSRKYRRFRASMLRGRLETCNKCFFS